jgi:hypothetical protein
MNCDNPTPPRRLIFRLGATLLAAVMATATASAAEPFETFTPRPVGDAVPAAMIQGEHYRLAPTVRTFDFLNDFVVSSDYGPFEPQSDAMLRRLIREIHAIAVLQGITLTEAYGKALAQAALSPVRGVQQLVTNPVETVKAVPTALFDVFERVGQGIDTAASGQTTGYEDSALAQALQMSAYKRDYARQLGVDPYSSNPVLQKDLDAVAWAAAAGNLTISAATMVSGSAVVAALSYARNIDQAVSIVAAQPPSELMIRNRAALDAMGIAPGLKEKFLGQKQYSPRAKTILIAALASMPSTAGRDSVLEVALGAPDETMAIFYQQLAELLNDYDDKVAPIVRLARYNRLVVAYEKSGKAVILAPVDYLIWNERAASAATRIAQAWKLKPGSDVLELWITGTTSPRFRKEAEALGIRVRERVGQQLPLVD